MLHIIVATVYISLCLLFTPCYVKLIHVFITSKTYRSRKAYKLMTQIGIAQCATSPGLIALGYSIATCNDPHGIASMLMKVMNSCRRVDAILSVALALERLQTIYIWRRLTFLVDGLTALAWLYGAANFGIFISPLAEFVVVPETFGPVYNSSYPATHTIKKVNFFSSVGASVATFILYLLIIARLIRQKLAVKTFNIDVNEKAIFIQAFVRFFCDTLMLIFYHIVPLILPRSVVLEITTTLGYIVNNLVLPPVLSIMKSTKGRPCVCSKGVNSAAILTHRYIKCSDCEALMSYSIFRPSSIYPK
uniref:Serpentine Receptor, class T n=1 Tax=Steinernema glaseri TaxID=37863 RepID=A0A1I7Z6K6_9BILA